LQDGREVAVKVQHPGIAKAMDADLSNASVFESMAALGGARRFQSKEVLEVIRARFREEIDYRHEASQQSWFRAHHAGDPRIRVPEVIEDRCSTRVLTSDLVRGLGFDEACAAPASDREAWAQTIWRFVFKGNLVGGRFNADPHPGNYIFHEGGGVTFLDYGCIQPLGADHAPHARAMHRAAIERDEARFREACRGLFRSKPGRHEELVLQFSRSCFEPLFRQPFRFTRDYAASLVDEVRDVGRAALSLKDDEILEMPSDMFFINRLEFGLYSVLARLDVTVDYAAVERGFWHELPD
jgi:predicted unusual protein kinase regulating ubiquinone biosynthesis (AarF/ABC1/UbiB family)